MPHRRLARGAAFVVSGLADSPTGAPWTAPARSCTRKWRPIGPEDLPIEDGRLRWIPYALGGPVRIGGRWLDAAPHLLPIAGTTDLWALDRIFSQFMRVDRNLAAELTRASTAERGLAVAAMLLFPVALAATLLQRSRRRRQPAAT